MDSAIGFSFLGSWRLGEVVGDGLEFFEGGLEIFNDLGGEDVTHQARTTSLPIPLLAST